MQPKWFEAGAKDYGYSPLALIALEFLLLGFLEVKRYQGFKRTGTVSPPPTSSASSHGMPTAFQVFAGLQVHRHGAPLSSLGCM